jgi:hypothetical protein
LLFALLLVATGSCATLFGRFLSTLRLVILLVRVILRLAALTTFGRSIIIIFILIVVITIIILVLDNLKVVLKS